MTEAKEAGVEIFGGGGLQRQRASVVRSDETVTAGPFPETEAVVGGLAVVGWRRGVEVVSRPQAFDRAARIAAGCRPC